MNNKVQVKKLKNLAEIISGIYIPSIYRKSYGDWQLIRSRNIKEKNITESDIFVPNELIQKYVRAIIVPGDVLLSLMFGQYKVGIVPAKFPAAIADRGIVILRPKSINKEYLRNFLVSKTGYVTLFKQLIKMTRGDVIKYVTKKDIGDLNIPILPKELLALSNDVKNITSNLTEIQFKFEKEIIESVYQILLDKGWKKNEIFQQYSLSPGLRVDFFIKSKNNPSFLIEIKRYFKHPILVKEQIISMLKKSEVRNLFLISSEGLQKINLTGKFEKVVDLPKPKKIMNHNNDQASGTALQYIAEQVENMSKRFNDLSIDVTTIKQNTNFIKGQINLLIDSLIIDIKSIKNESREDEEKIILIESKIDELLKKNTQYENESSIYSKLASKETQTWDKLDPISKELLTSAEYLYSVLQKIGKADFSPCVIQYSKAIENELFLVYFKPFIDHINKISNLPELLIRDIGDTKTRLFAQQVISGSNNKNLTLGQMIFIINLSRNYISSYLIEQYSKFIKNKIDEKFIKDVIYINESLRRKSAHPEIMKIEKAIEAKEKIPKLINIMHS